MNLYLFCINKKLHLFIWSMWNNYISNKDNFSSINFHYIETEILESGGYISFIAFALVSRCYS